MENNPVLKLRIAQVQKLKFAQVKKIMKIAQVHPNLVAREDALEYVEVGINININMNININGMSTSIIPIIGQVFILDFLAILTHSQPILIAAWA